MNQSAAQSFVIQIDAVNDEQVLAVNAGLTTTQGSTSTITGRSWKLPMLTIRRPNCCIQLPPDPLMGLVLLNGLPVTQFSQQDVNAGLVSYQNDSTASAADSFDFSVDDGAGSASTGTFSITIRPNPGDYDQNLTVEAADYVLWRKTLGATGLPAFSGADGDGDTTIDPDDYDVWRGHFGQTVEAGNETSVEGVSSSWNGGELNAAGALAESVAPEQDLQAGASLARSVRVDRTFEFRTAGPANSGSARKGRSIPGV